MAEHNPEAIRAGLAQRIVEAKSAIRKYNRLIEDEQEKLRRAEGTITTGGYILLAGVVLILAAGLGLLIIPVGFLIRFINFRKKGNAQRAIKKYRAHVDYVEGELEKAEIQLAGLPYLAPTQVNQSSEPRRYDDPRR